MYRPLTLEEPALTSRHSKKETQVSLTHARTGTKTGKPAGIAEQSAGAVVRGIWAEAE